jgi:type 1 glutamine amidotransferase
MSKKILVISAGLAHPSWLARRYFHAVLAAVPGIACEFSTRVESLRRLESGRYDAVALYLHRQEISAAALAALDGFVAAGGGMLAVHSASASFKREDGFFKILGGRFVGHGPVGTFSIVPEKGAPGWFDAGESFTVRDELYIHEYDTDNTIHYSTAKASGSEPMVWTRTYGRGRVCYLAPGHLARTMKNARIGKIIERGLSWVAGVDNDS